MAVGVGCEVVAVKRRPQFSARYRIGRYGWEPRPLDPTAPLELGKWYRFEHVGDAATITMSPSLRLSASAGTLTVYPA